MLDEYRIEQMNIGQYIDSVHEKEITVNQAVQRAFCWSNEMINNLVYSAVAKKRIYIPNIILAEEKRKDGTKRKYVVDGGQRTEALERFRYGEHKITKSIRNRYVEYQAKMRDEDGNILLDEDGNPICELKTFDLVNKRFEDFPPELQKRFDKCCISTAIYQECTPKETSELVMLYNSTVSMTASQKSFTYLNNFAEKVKSIKENNTFLKDCTMLGGNDKKKGIWERTIYESVMSMFYFDDWKSNPKDICSYLNNNASEKDFDSLDDYMNRLIPYSDKLSQTEVAELFIPKDIPVWMKFFKESKDKGISDEDFGKFIIAFNDMKEIEVNDTTWIELDKDKHTKDKKTIIKKVTYLEELLNNFLHTEDPEESTEITECDNTLNNEVANIYEEIEKKLPEELLDRSSLDDDLEPIEFLHKYVSPEITEEDLDEYYDDINYFVKKRLLPKDHNLINEKNEVSFLAIVAYAMRKEKDNEFEMWLKRYAITHRSVTARTQRDNYIEMVNNFERALNAKKGAIA